MPALAIDTATEVMSIALGDGPLLLGEMSVDAGRSHLELLLPSLHDLLKKKRLRPRNISAIVAGIGPGTFSGLRVGISTARALAQTLEAPLFGFSTLEALALELAVGTGGDEYRLLLPIIDAKRGQVFARLYKKEGDKGVTPASDVLCLDPVALMEKLAGLTREPIRAGGNGAIAYRDMFTTNGQLKIISAEDHRNRVRAFWHLRAASPGATFSPGRLLAVVPEYVREPDADKTILLRKREPWLK